MKYNTKVILQAVGVLNLTQGHLVDQFIEDEDQNEEWEFPICPLKGLPFTIAVMQRTELPSAKGNTVMKKLLDLSDDYHGSDHAEEIIHDLAIDSGLNEYDLKEVFNFLLEKETQEAHNPS